MAGRIAEMFEGLKDRRAALIAYATGYYPDRLQSEGVIRAMLESGADAVEIGIPFSDPVMDGPVIQETSTSALAAGATTSRILDLVSAIRPDTDRPLLVMTYYNPIFHYGLDGFASDAAASGVDGVIVPDLPVEEMRPLKDACDAAGIDTVAFCSATTSPERIEAAAGMSSGFLYCVSLLGTTGTRDSVSSDLPEFLARVRDHADCPIAVGLGISTPEQCAEVGKMADGIIVGSALMKAVLKENGELRTLSDMVRGMAAAL